jgi:hypothetical protein
MKKTVLKVVALFALVAATAASTFAQGSFAYQAVIRQDGKVVSNKKVSMQFTLSSDKTPYYVEKQAPTTNDYGNVSVMIGAGEKVSGDFMKVPWSKMNVMLKIEVDAAGGNNYIELGEIQLQPVPYAVYAMQAGGAKQASTASPDDAIFEVKDKDGQVVFAVYPDGVKVYVDDSEDAPKAKRSGFVVTGRPVSKDAETTDFFAVNAEGTQIFVDDAEDATSKAKRSGLIVTGRPVSKDATPEKYLTVDSEGTHVYVDDATDKAKRSGFVVTGRPVSKDDASADLFKIDGNGTQVYIDETATDKAKRSGFVVTGRPVSKDGEADQYFAVNADGTQVIVDEMNSSKAKRSGFVVTGRPVSKGANPDSVLAIDITGTKVYIDDKATGDKAKRSGFVVTGRPVSKDGEANEYLAVTPESIDFSSTSFNVADKNNGNKVLSVENGNVHVNSDMLLTGEIGKVLARVEGADNAVTYSAELSIDAEYIYRLIDDAVIEPEDYDDPLFFDADGNLASYGSENAVLKVYESEGEVAFELKPEYTVAKAFTIRFAVEYDGEFKAYTVTIPASN